MVGYALLCEGEERRCARAINYISESPNREATYSNIYVIELIIL